jgi:hypothetical protein
MGGMLVEERARALALRVPFHDISVRRDFHDMEITGEDALNHLKELAAHDTSVRAVALRKCTKLPRASNEEEQRQVGRPRGWR